MSLTAQERAALYAHESEARKLRRKASRAAKEGRAKSERVDPATKLNGEPGAGTKRLSMSPARRARILALYDHVCAGEGCGDTDGLELDHAIPLELGGTDADFNIAPLCRFHHAEKTRGDIARIAKAKRQAKLLKPREPSKRPIKSRGFQKRAAP